ncbi:MAG: substrate-binding domain-containing protein, partial [Pygmaiobacter sp.]
TDIGLSSRKLQDTETGLKEITVALDGIAVVVNNKNTISDLTLDQINGLASGKITNWKDVGGADAPVVMIGREAGSGTRDGFETIVGVKDSCKYAQELTATGAVIAAVAANENAIGYASLSAVEDTIKPIKVEGVVASEASVLDGSYKIQRPFSFIVKDGATQSDAVTAFIAFAQSKDAADIIAAAGAVPLSK